MTLETLTLGGSSARADLQRGTVLTEAQRWEHAHKLWNDNDRGAQQHVDDGAIGHYSAGGPYPVFYVWRELRSEWVLDYSRVIDEEQCEAASWQCRD